MRVRMIFSLPPQHLHLIAGRGLGVAGILNSALSAASDQARAPLAACRPSIQANRFPGLAGEF